MSFLGTMIAGFAGRPRKAGSQPVTPEYYTDPNFSKQQDFLGSYYNKILQGDIPDFYKAIGMPTDTNLMGNYISESGADIKRAANERAAQMGTGRSPIGADTMAALGNQSATLRFADYQRAMQGRENLLGFGAQGSEGVRGAAFENMMAKNPYQQWGYGADLEKERYLQNRRDMMRKYDSELVGNSDTAFWNDVSSTFGGLSSMFGGQGGQSQGAGQGSQGGVGGGVGGGISSPYGQIFGGISQATKGYSRNPYANNAYWGKFQ